MKGRAEPVLEWVGLSFSTTRVSPFPSCLAHPRQNETLPEGFEILSVDIHIHASNLQRRGRGLAFVSIFKCAGTRMRANAKRIRECGAELARRGASTSIGNGTRVCCHGTPCPAGDLFPGGLGKTDYGAVRLAPMSCRKQDRPFSESKTLWNRHARGELGSLRTNRTDKNCKLPATVPR